MVAGPSHDCIDTTMGRRSVAVAGRDGEEDQAFNTSETDCLATGQIIGLV